MNHFNLLRPTDSANSLKSYGFASGFPRNLLRPTRKQYSDELRSREFPRIPSASRPQYFANSLKSYGFASGFPRRSRVRKVSFETGLVFPSFIRRTRKSTPFARVMYQGFTESVVPHKNGMKICGHIISRKNGWVVATVHGNATERGYAHGALLHSELKRVLECFPFLVKTDFHTTFDEYIQRCKTKIRPILERDYREYFDELSGICLGAKSKGLDISVDILIGWNSCLSMYEEYDSMPEPQRCSAFIATGNATAKGDIVMAHNTHCNFVLGSLSNIVLYVDPSDGHSFCMQTCPGMICSSMDWFICSNGMVGCETTISGIKYKPVFGAPYYCRIRDCMQYRNSLDEYATTMLHKNAGDYAGSWLFGDTRTGEIMLCEIGLKTHHIEKTRNGVFYGMNSVMDPIMRLGETTDTSAGDISQSSGARRARFEYLLTDKYAGKITASNAKLVLADHYDVLLNRNHLGLRCICKHSELSNENAKRTPFYPHGAIDGKVVNTEMARKMAFVGKFGASCNRAFRAKSYLKKHPEYADWRDYLVNLPNRPWTEIQFTTASPP
jgi:hypothetical protein